MHPEQRLGIVFPLRVLQRPLMLQKRRTLHEKHRERTQRRINQRVMGILPPPSVGKCFKGRAQLLRNSAKGQYIGTKGNAHGSTYRLLDPPTLVLCQVYFDGIYNQTLPMGKGIRKVWLWQ